MDEYELADSSPPEEPQPGPREAMEDSAAREHEVLLNKKTVRKLDLILLPFLALLFLFNSLDKSNIGNAESAHFTSDIGLEKDDLNTAVALFFAFFVTLQPVGAALGRKYGMVLWVPSCMTLWGISTALHVWVRARWQLFTLRIIIGCLEAGFYPVTVSYLSLFYTRFEFARRLSLFYGQAAVAGALGGILSYFVFSQFNNNRRNPNPEPSQDNGWKSWQVLFLLEGGSTVIVALVGFLWLPHSAKTAWFLSKEEREWAEERIRRDRSSESTSRSPAKADNDNDNDADENDDEESQHPSASESHGLLHPSRSSHSARSTTTSITDDRGLTPHDILSALLSPKIYHLLACNILSSIPVTAFSVFLPLVLAPLTQPDPTDPTHPPNPALTNLLTAPPYICGALTLYAFATYSDHHRRRLPPILAGLALLLAGLALVTLLPATWPIPRYLALNVLLAGTFVASPLAVAWIAGNTPQPGKRALLLGVNGWGNLAGVFSALLFRPRWAGDGYVVPFWVTLGCVGVAAGGYLLFWRNLVRENRWRMEVLRGWDADEVERERVEGKGPLGGRRGVVDVVGEWMLRVKGLEGVGRWVERAREGGREGDERVTFIYGL